MRKIVSYALSTMFLAAGMAACAKSTKGKVANEWKVVSYVKTESYSDPDQNYSNSSAMNLTETSFTQQSTSTNGGMSVNNNYSGSVNEHELIIKKDGTWSWKRDMTYDYGNGDGNKTIDEQTGTWTFVGKTKGDDFKKNERLLFNILSETRTSSQITNQVVVNQFASNKTYLAGENVLIYTIKESKRKEMELESVNDVAITSDYGSSSGNTDKEMTTMTLKEK
jgi:hypothetical protein